MFLKTLQLHQFKNHRESKFTFTNPVNCFVGNNGAGKTNILDAIHYLSLTKSYFNYIDTGNIKFNEEYFILKGDFVKNTNNEAIECSVQIKKGKIIKRNKKRYKKFSEHIGQFPLIIISPTDTNLIIEGGEARRKYLNSSIAQYDQSYLYDLISYNKILKQRNSLLKKFQDENSFDPVVLETYNLQMIKYAEIIYNHRKNFLKKLVPVFNKYYSEICEQKENVDIEYKSHLNTENLGILLQESIQKDRLSQHTTFGVHKDDMIFKMNNYPIKKIGSQGQQKSFLISLKLAQFEFMHNEINFKPILLLDDIFDKLDNKRVQQLINLVKRNKFGQVFITDTNFERSQSILCDSEVPFQMFHVKNGEVKI